MISHGARSVRSGQYGEAIITAAFEVHDVKAVTDNEGYHNEPQLWARKGKILICQHKMQSGRVVDFLYKDFDRDLTLAIEHKQQMGNGTTDEKLAYTADSLATSEYGLYWIILSGGGFSPKVIRVIEKKIRKYNDTTNTRGRLVHNQGPFLQRAIEQLIDQGNP